MLEMTYLFSVLHVAFRSTSKLMSWLFDSPFGTDI
jgi:hypothetical protein